MIGPTHLYRIARSLHRLKVPVLPRCLDYLNRLIFACWIPHSALLGKNLILGYGALGIVIHDTARIGDNVHIDQGVTIGGNATQRGAPRIGNHVYIGAGAKILGPISIGDGSVIGANAVVVRDVPPRSLVVGIPGRVLRNEIDIASFLYHQRSQT